jgi:hypothetical protein
VGNDGETLVADSSTSTGLRYQSNFSAGKNKVINGDFNIWQRGTSFTNPSGTFTADRFSWDTVAMVGTVTRQAFTPGTAPVAGYEGTYFARLDITSGSQYGEYSHKIEDARTFALQTITVSFWARLNSGASGWQTNVVQNFGTGGSPSSAVLVGQTAFTPTSSWQRFTYSVTVNSVSGKTFGTNNNSFLNITVQKTSTTASQLDIWGLQVEASNTATAFQTATGTLQGELAACQRYYWRLLCDVDFGAGVAASNTVNILSMSLPVTMRTKPVTFDSNALQLYSLAAGGYYSGGAFTLYVSTPNTAEVRYTHGSAVFATNQLSLWSGSLSTSYIGFGAEL